jgi:putative intracellular protease/amidase
MKVAYVVYPDFTALDLVGPYEVISRWPDVEVHFVASSSGAVRTDCGLTVLPTDTPETLPGPDLFLSGGGLGHRVPTTRRLPTQTGAAKSCG